LMQSLEADVSYARHAPTIELKGRVQAQITQTCVVTLEPLVSHIDESFTIRFDPELIPEEYEVSELSPEDLLDEADIRPLIGATIDLGEVAAECLGLAIEPYPRRAGSTVDPRYAGASDTVGSKANPFAVLKKLKF